MVDLRSRENRIVFQKSRAFYDALLREIHVRHMPNETASV